MFQCEKCREFRFIEFGGKPVKCHCKPFTIIDEDGDEHESVYAMDESGAARKYAEMSNVEGDYYLMDNSVNILVNGKAFRISAEPDINYNAEEI